MRCELAREALSADLDGELVATERDRLQIHLAGCRACRDWRESSHVLTRRTRLGGALPTLGAADLVLAAVRDDRRRRRTRHYWLAVARAVIGVGLLQLLATVPLLVLARDSSSAGGRVVLAVVELAIGAAFFLGALVVLWRERDHGTLQLVELAPRRGAERSVRSQIDEVA